MVRSTHVVFVLAFVLSVVSGEALAHTPNALADGGLMAGFLHPFGGFDHLAATLAVGAWIARLERQALVIVPVAILAALGAGLVTGLEGFPVSAEAGIIASLVVLAAALLFDLRPIPIVAAAAAGFFAFFHGHAHGAEIPALADPTTYAAGLGIASAQLMILGAILARRGIGHDRLKAAPRT